MAASPPPRDTPGGWGWAAFHAAHLWDYNRPATTLWLSIVALGGAALAGSLAWLAQLPSGAVWEVLGWTLIAAIAAAMPITIPRTKTSIATGDVMIFLLLALHGTAAACVAAALETFIAASRTSPRKSSRIVSAGAGAFGMALAGMAFSWVQPLLAATGLGLAAAHLAAVGAASFVYFVATTAPLMKVIALKKSQPLSLADWYRQGSWVGTLYLMSGALAGMLSLNAQHFGHASVAVGVLMIGLSLTLLRTHFRSQIQEHQAQEARVAAAQSEAHRNQQRFHAAFTQASIGMAIVGSDGEVQKANSALAVLLGHGDDTRPLLARPFQELLHAGDAGLLERHVADLRQRTHDRFSIELRCVGADRREIWVSLHCARFGDDASEAAGDNGGLIFQLHDISSRRRAEGELLHIAYHDPLTDLANRRCFLERLAVAVEASRDDRRRRFAVMALDLDRFKIVNDSLGHGGGDALLVEVAQRLLGCVRPQDLVARLGGDEFAILVEDPRDQDDVLALGQRVLRALDKPAKINGTEVRALASIGVTFSDMGYREPDEMLRDADLAMYRAKADGKGRLVRFDASLHEQHGHKLQLESDLRRAIGEGQLSLAFQPLYRLEPHRLEGFEALARWTHPVRGNISPAVFIALAEETGCIEALTAWAIEEAARQHAEWLTCLPQAQGLAMHVNVSGRDLAAPQFVPHVKSVLQRHALPPRTLLLEITESTLMEHREQATRTLQEMSALGVEVGIDDFGTGYSSLAYLSTLPFDCLKIDRSFVIGMEQSRQNLEIVRTVISLGKTLGKQVVAEGIETVEQLAKLRQLGADIGQGYLMSRPLTAQQAQALLAEPQLAPV